MNDNTKGLVLSFFNRYVRLPSTVLEVGSRDINGNLRADVESLGHRYAGLDVVSGPNVDIVSPYHYDFPFSDGSFDVVFSASTAYAVFNLHRWTKELSRLVKSGGYLCVITSNFTKPAIKYIPGVVDMWRASPQALVMLFNDTKRLDVIDAYDQEMDAICIGRKR